jgi:hypothetical protein
MVARQQVLDNASVLGACCHVDYRIWTMSRFRRIKLQHIRQVNEECHSKEKEVAYKKWQANQIQIWKGMNALALMEEAKIKKLSELLDKTDQS